MVRLLLAFFWHLWICFDRVFPKFTYEIHTELQIFARLYSGLHHSSLEYPDIAMREIIYRSYQSYILYSSRFRAWWQVHCEWERRHEDIHVGSTEQESGAGARRSQRYVLKIRVHSNHHIDSRGIPDVVITVAVRKYNIRISNAILTIRPTESPDSIYPCFGIHGKGPYHTFVGRSERRG